MRTVGYDEIKKMVRLEDVIDPVRESFKSYSAGKANIPPVQHLEMPACRNGALHIKTGHVEPLPFCLVKVASTFPENTREVPPKPSINGVIMVFSTRDGEPLAVLEDRAWITQARTAGAGAVAAVLLGRAGARTLGVVGAGTQARLQTRAILHVRPEIDQVLVWGRTPAHVESYVEEISKARPGLETRAADTVEDVARAADVLVTTTYSTQPLVKGEWLQEGVLVIGMGADAVHKLEIDPASLPAMDRVIVDSRSQNLKMAEIGCGIRSGLFDANRIDAEIGELLLKGGAVRASDSERIVCKLTGVAVQEIFVCEFLLKELGIVN
jgi:ornithine cyclodeaminase